jgi:4-amino-4-deoxy-L-arabinose transferase-like glycosyltransferase
VNGHLPYTTVWESKPPLFFALLAAAMLVFGKSMLAMRLATDVAIAATAFALYFLGTSVRRGGHAIGLTAALLYVALTISDSGLSAVAETFSVPFVAIPLAIVLRGSWPPASHRFARLVALGACLGCAVLVKESALIEVAYVACVVVWVSDARSLVPLGLGVVLSVGASALPYLATRNLGLYWDANVASLARRAFVAVPDVAPWSDVVRSQLLAFFPATLLVFGVRWVWLREETGFEERGLIVAMTGWALVNFLTVVLIREYLGNHFIPMMAPFCVLGALVTVRLAERLRRPAFVPGVIALALLAHATYQFVLAAPVAYGRLRFHDPAYGDPTAQLARFIVAHRGPRQALYVADDRTVLYLLTGASSPTRFAYPPHLLDRYQELVAGVDGQREIARILQQYPTYVVRDAVNRRYEDPHCRALLDRALGSEYRIVDTLGTRTIYALAKPSTAPPI